ncbi:MAG: dihydrofolate reductase [Alphaproteobacteria bacterium]|nr:dihydrofolate reductase [Alphaproteobacteria bacterium]
MILSLIVAVAENGVIGRANGLPWRLKGDLAWFKKQTLGKPVIMGRKTWDSLPKKPLPQRANIVISRDAGFAPGGAVAVRSLDEALAAAGDVPEAMVIGGAEIFAQAMARAGRLYLTEVHGRPEGDIFMPARDCRWLEVFRERRARVEDEAYDYSFVILERMP